VEVRHATHNVAQHIVDGAPSDFAAVKMGDTDTEV